VDIEFSNPRRRAALIRRGLMRLSRRLRGERTDETLSASKLALMGWLRRSGGMTPTEIAAAERIRPQSLTRLLSALDEDGLIARRADAADRRRIVIVLTPAGRRALEDDMKQRDAWLAQAMTHALSPTEQELLRLAAQLMERLADVDLPGVERTGVDLAEANESEKARTDDHSS
jgi:DNA-binding MarR family transcriptional regulator